MELAQREVGYTQRLVFDYPTRGFASVAGIVRRPAVSINPALLAAHLECE